MKKNVTIDDFGKAFDLLRPNNFTGWGQDALYNYLVEIEEETDQEIELDVIALCCDFTEYGSFDEFNQDYPDINSMKELQENTTVIGIPYSTQPREDKITGGFSSGFIIHNF
mgnify:CR=1 FL=1